MRRLLTPALFALALAFVSTAAVGEDAAFERGRAARQVGDLDAAERAFQEVLRRDPQHYRALYNMAMVFEGRGVRAPAGSARLAHFRTAAAWLDRAYRSPKRATAGEHAYTIYNTRGLIYLALGDLRQARIFLLEGYKHRDRLSEKSRGRLYANLGYLYALQGDRNRALHFFREGAALKSNFATLSLQKLNAAGIR